MGYTKADRKKFLDELENNLSIMPTVARKSQQSLFDEDVIETSSPNMKMQKITLTLVYPELDDNPKRDPVPKQSARFMVERYKSGEHKGDPIVYTMKGSTRKNVMIKSYQDARITNTTKMLKEQIAIQLKKLGTFTMFRESIFVTRMEFIFKVSDNAPKYMLRDLESGDKIYFKDTKPDLDNLEKLVWDSMQAEKMEKEAMSALTDMVYENDAQIVSKNGIFKRWGIRPGVIIEMQGYV